jgi:hypothetical protein
MTTRASRLKWILSLACAVLAGLVLAAGPPSVTISAPVDGAALSAKSKIPVTYDAVPGPEGNHLHVYVDGKEVGQWHRLKGTQTLAPMTAGKHEICLHLATKAHVELGVNKCTSVTVQ